MGSVVANQVVERLSVRVHLSCLDCLTELRLVASDCFELSLECLADVDDEGRFLMVFTKRQGVNDLEWAMGLDFRLDFFQASHEACIPHELRDYRMIGMSSMQRVRDHHFRLKPPDYHGQFRARVRRVLN